MVGYDLTQILAEGSGCKCGVVGIPDHDTRPAEAGRNDAFVSHENEWIKFPTDCAHSTAIDIFSNEPNKYRIISE